MSKHPNKKAVDVIEKILDACYQYNPDALFVLSLMHQYEARGSLSKKQLMGLHQKASKVPGLPQHWLSTLQAIILKMPERHKIANETPVPSVNNTTNSYEEFLSIIASILQKYPQHKGALLLQTKCNLKQLLTNEEKSQLKQWQKLL